MNIFTTDGQLASSDIVVLNDDKNFYQTYYCGTVVREEVLKKYPELEAVLMKMENILTDKEMAELNNKVEDLELKEGKKRRSTISELDLYGCSHILDEFTEFTHYATENTDLLSCIDGIKTIAVINIDSNDISYNKLLPIYNKLMDIDSEKIVNLKANISQKDDNDMDPHKIQRNIRQKNLNIDISIVFIE